MSEGSSSCLSPPTDGIGPAELSDRAGGGRMALSLGLGGANGWAVGGDGGIGGVVNVEGIDEVGSFTLKGSGLLSNI